MEYHAGIDVSLKESSVCVVDLAGKIVHEVKVAGEPEAFVRYFDELGLPVSRVGLEAGPLSQRLHRGFIATGRDAVLLETRHGKAALSAMTVKTDRKDARGIAQLLRMGWYLPVHAKSAPCKDTRALLAGCTLLQGKSRNLAIIGSSRIQQQRVASRCGVHDHEVVARFDNHPREGLKDGDFLGAGRAQIFFEQGAPLSIELRALRRQLTFCMGMIISQSGRAPGDSPRQPWLRQARSIRARSTRLADSVREPARRVNSATASRVNPNSITRRRAAIIRSVSFSKSPDRNINAASFRRNPSHMSGFKELIY
jgi:hypothetical protein